MCRVKSWMGLFFTMVVMLVLGSVHAIAATTMYLSLPGAAFLQSEDGYDYERYNGYLTPRDNASPLYYTPVYLPDGAQIPTYPLSGIVCGTCTDCSVGITLYRTSFVDGSKVLMRQLMINNSNQSCTLITNYSGVSGSPSIIDNEVNAYFLELSGMEGVGSNQLQFKGARIEYMIESNINPSQNQRAVMFPIVTKPKP